MSPWFAARRVLHGRRALYGGRSLGSQMVSILLSLLFLGWMVSAVVRGLLDPPL